MSSDAQIRANRENAKLSTGPQTPEGKHKVSLNAIKTGLTGRTVLLPSDDVDEYRLHCERLVRQLDPRCERERALVDRIAATEWRLLRIPVLELGIYAMGRRQCADLFSDESDSAIRTALIETQIYLTYDKQLKNLAIQERRLRTQSSEDRLELDRLQKLRQQAIKEAARQYTQCNETHKPFAIEEFGFEITNEEVEKQVAAYDEFNRMMAERSVPTLGFSPRRRPKDAA